MTTSIARPFLAALAPLLGLVLLVGCSGPDRSAEAAGSDEDGTATAEVSSDDVTSAMPVATTPRVSTPVPTQKPRGTRAPGFTLTSVDGVPVSLDDYAGDVVLLDFWATWCGPCRMAIPHLIELQDELGPQGFQIVGISVDQAAATAVGSFAERAGINYPVVMGTAQVQRAYGGIRSIPTAFLVDRDGYVVKMIRGYRTKAQMEAEILPHLEG